MSYNAQILDGNKTLKTAHKKTCGNLVQINLDNVLQMLQAHGADPAMNLGGKHVEIHFDDKLHAGAGAPRGATGTVGHLYTDRKHGVIGAVTPDFIFGYSTKRFEKGALWQEGGEETNYIDEIGQADVHCFRMIAHLRSAMFAWEGNGKINEIAINSAQIDANGGTGTMRVAVRDHLQENFLFEVRDGSGTPIANVAFRVEDINPGPLEGEIAVTNIGSANYTPTIGHQLYALDSAGNYAMPGLLSACNNDAYPLAGLNNVQINNSKFKAQVEQATVGQPLSHRDLILFDQKGRNRMPHDVKTGFDTRNKVRTNFATYETCAGVYLMNSSMFNALRDTFFQTGNANGIGINRFERTGNYPTEIDQGWGLIHIVDGIKVHVTDFIPNGYVLRVYGPGFNIKFTDPVRVSRSDLRNMGHVGGSVNFELIYAQLGTAYTRNRMPQGRFTGRTGFNEVSAGWEEEGY